MCLDSNPGVLGPCLSIFIDRFCHYLIKEHTNKCVLGVRLVCSFRLLGGGNEVLLPWVPCREADTAVSRPECPRQLGSLQGDPACSCPRWSSFSRCHSHFCKRQNPDQTPRQVFEGKYLSLRGSTLSAWPSVRGSNGRLCLLLAYAMATFHTLLLLPPSKPVGLPAAPISQMGELKSPDSVTLRATRW